MERGLLAPLQAVRDWAARVRKGDLSARVAAAEDEEFSDLVADVNMLGDDLQALSRDMESQVMAQTESLEQKTRSLEMLYDVAASINVSRDLNDLLARFLRTLSDAMGARAASIRLVEGDALRLVTSTGVEGHEGMVETRPLDTTGCLCAEVATKGYTRFEDWQAGCCGGVAARLATERSPLKMVVVPLQYRNRTFGVYNLFIEEHKLARHEDIIVLLTSLGQHLGMAIERAGLDKETERLSRMEERTRLAHELHDSLAQTLASIRIQIRILDETLHQQDESAVWNHLETVESSVDEAYGELRELIARFRAPIDEHGLVPSIEKIVQRFKKESGILTFFHNDLVGTDLPENMELQVVRIVQEALNNARKHSDANAVRVMIRHENDEYRVLIEDDGIGFGTPAANGRPGEHLGLTIMRERAERIGGKLKIESDPNEGTRIHLVFRHPPDDDADGAKKTRAAS
jgi:two-component system nitrate/nitrite sensor histidine kinase NarX